VVHAAQLGPCGQPDPDENGQRNGDGDALLHTDQDHGQLPVPCRAADTN
jgi:hypothetical protein